MNKNNYLAKGINIENAIPSKAIHPGEELYEELSDEDGWAVLVNFHPSAQHDFLLRKLNRYIELMEISAWRTYKPEHFFQFIDQKLSQRLGL